MKAVASLLLVMLLALLPAGSATAMDDDADEGTGTEEAAEETPGTVGGSGEQSGNENAREDAGNDAPAEQDAETDGNTLGDVEAVEPGVPGSVGESGGGAEEAASSGGGGVVPVSRPAARDVSASNCVEWLPVSVIGEREDGSSILSDPVCRRSYSCASERIDDIVSGHIEGEADGAYAEYVVGFAARIDDQNAAIIEVESNPVLSEGETAPIIPLASDEQGISQLTEVLAENGLGEEPGELFIPQFNYCRRDQTDLIEISATVEPQYLPSFSWVALQDEYDIPAAGGDIYGRIVDQLVALDPELNSIPPLQDGVTIVRFPMWFWLNNHDQTITATATSQPNGTVQVNGRANLDRVIWHLGDTELICEPDDMKAYEPGMDLRSRTERPACHHIFTQLGEFTPEVTLVYAIEQQITTRRSPSHPYNAGPWLPHPNGAEATVTHTATNPLQIREIYALNVPFEG